MARRRGDRGTITAFTAIVTLALLVAAGLVLDGGEMLAAKREAIDEANAAARAGAQAVDIDALRGARDVRPRGDAAVQAAHAYLAGTGHAGTVEVRDRTVHVTIRVPVPLTLLGLIGMRTATVTGAGEARLVRGVTHGET